MMSQILESAKNFDFIRLSSVDFHGRSNSRMIPSSEIPNFVEDGHRIFSGFAAGGPLHEIPPIQEVFDNGFPNGLWRAAVDEIVEIPWSKSSYRVGEVICDTYFVSGEMEDWAPRYVLQKQIQSLKNEGFLFKSGFECEFTVHDEQTLEPVFPGVNPVSTTLTARFEPLLCSISSNMSKVGMQVDKFEVEYGPGQFEFTFHPEFGMKTADNTFRFRQALREICAEHHYVPTFMSAPYFVPHCFNGLHLNFSLWSQDDPKENVMLDKEGVQLSDPGRFFLGGIFAHVDAILSFLCPTINCYRRLGSMAISGEKHWTFEKRLCSIRVAKETKNGARVEVRLVSGIANPYLASAAIIAAGVDGLKNKTLPPEEGKPDGRVVDSLAAALDALEKDDVIKESLGSRFANWWILEKRECEVKVMGHHDMKTNNTEELEREKREYFEL